MIKTIFQQKGANILLVTLFFLITIFTGIFLYQIKSGANLVDVPQFAYLILSGGLLFSFTLKNRYLMLLVQLMFVRIFMTYLGGDGINIRFLKSTLVVLSALGIYKYFLETKINIIKYFTIPAGLNALLIIFQKLLPNLVPFNDSITGFLGNAGFSGCFIGVTAPLFLSYFPIGWFLCLFALVIGKSLVGLIAFLVSTAIWLHYKQSFLFRPFVLITLIMTPFLKYIGSSHEINFRISTWLGTLDGIKYHWFKGWGLGSFIDIMSQNNDVYYKIPFNTSIAKLNHPANEFLYGWWNFGILFPILAILYIKDLFKKFTIDKLTLFCVLIGCLCVSIGFMFTPPLLFLAMAILGLYESSNYRLKDRKI